MICGSVGSDAAGRHVISRYQPVTAAQSSLNKRRADPGPSLLTSTVNIPSLYSRLIREFNNAPGLPNQGSNSPGWLRISLASTCSPSPVPTHKAGKQKFTHSHPRFILQPQPHATPSNRGMLISTVNVFCFLPLFCFSFLWRSSTSASSYNLQHKLKPTKTADGIFNLHYASWHWRKGEGKRVCLRWGNGIKSRETSISLRSCARERKTGHVLTYNEGTLHFGRIVISESHYQVFFLFFLQSPFSMSL